MIPKFYARVSFNLFYTTKFSHIDYIIAVQSVLLIIAIFSLLTLEQADACTLPNCHHPKPRPPSKYSPALRPRPPHPRPRPCPKHRERWVIRCFIPHLCPQFQLKPWPAHCPKPTFRPRPTPPQTKPPFQIKPTDHPQSTFQPPISHKPSTAPIKPPTKRPKTPKPIHSTPALPQTPAWHIDIPSVINPNMEDQPVNFACTIADVRTEPICSGAIISLHFVVSSCLCLQRNMLPAPEESLRVLVAGFSEQRGTGMEVTIYEIENVVLHPGCFKEGVYHLKFDIGIAKTIDQIGFSSTIGAAKIPSEKGIKPNINRNWFLSALRPRNTIATSQRESIWFIKVRYVAQHICRKVLNESLYDINHNYCTPYHHVGGIGTCAYDFGASLSIDDTLIGILIHKFLCGSVGSAASFVSVAANRDWIMDIVQTLSGGSESV